MTQRSVVDELPTSQEQSCAPPHLELQEQCEFSATDQRLYSLSVVVLCDILVQELSAQR